jgi:hypothetical protein
LAHFVLPHRKQGRDARKLSFDAPHLLAVYKYLHVPSAAARVIEKDGIKRRASSSDK